MAQLKTKETHNKPQDRKAWRYRLTTMLYEQSYGEQAILELHNFLDWMMKLPEDLERQFQTELKAFEEAKQMKYVTTIERMAEERGEERGAKSKETEIALNMLRKNLSLETIADVTGLTVAQLHKLQSEMNSI